MTSQAQKEIIKALDTLEINNIKMKIGIFKQDFLKPLDRLSKLVSNRPLLPILDCVKVDIYGELAYLTAGNESTIMSIKTSVPSGCGGEFSFCTDLKLFQEALRKMPDVGLSLELKDDSCIIINFNSGEISLPVFDKNEFPKLDKIEGESVIIDEHLSKNIEKAFRFAGNDDLRPVMNGVYFDTKMGRVVATDGFSLYMCSSLPINESISAFNLTRDVYSAIKGLSNYSIASNNRLAYIKGNDFVISTKLLEGIYPNYMSVIPDNPIEYIVDRDALLKAIDRSMICSGDTSLVKLDLIETEIKITTTDVDRNRLFNESMPCNGNGFGEIGLKGSLATMCLGSLDTDMIMFTYADKSRAVTINPVSDDGLESKELVLLMPMLI